MSRYSVKQLRFVGMMVLLLVLVLMGLFLSQQVIKPGPVQAADIQPETTRLQSFDVPRREIVPCDDPTAQSLCGDGTCSTAAPDEFGACFLHGGVVGPADPNAQPTAQPVFPTATPIPSPTPNPLTPTPIPTLKLGPRIDPGDNLVSNGNFEFGFYQVPQLGFEPPDVGNVPVSWDWFRNQTYGKYNIYNNQGLGLICPDDLDDEAEGKNSLSLHMQSTDEQDARLGVYQTVDVVEGQAYLFYMAGAIQVQPGGYSPDKNHNMLLYFDHTGNTNWQSIPHEKWLRAGWREQDLEFEVSGPDDPDLTVIQDYYQVIEAKSGQLTIFIMGWRRWANWRTGIFTVDCVTLVPIGEVENLAEIIPSMSRISATVVDEALEAASVQAPAQPAPEAQPAAAVPGEEPEVEPAAESVIIPPSGGILESTENTLLIGSASVVLILGLVSAGVWNARRRKK
jgi:hypothetical protein